MIISYTRKFDKLTGIFIFIMVDTEFEYETKFHSTPKYWDPFVREYIARNYSIRYIAKQFASLVLKDMRLRNSSHGTRLYSNSLDYQIECARDIIGEELALDLKRIRDEYIQTLGMVG